MQAPGIHKAVLRELLIPRHWRPSESRDFFLDAEQICQLCDAAETIFQAEPTLLQLKGAWVWVWVRWGGVGMDGMPAPPDPVSPCGPTHARPVQLR